jgi:hypothetical protein
MLLLEDDVVAPWWPIEHGLGTALRRMMIAVDDGLCSVSMAKIDYCRSMRMREDDGAWRQQFPDGW